jgi:hypothetical protein
LGGSRANSHQIDSLAASQSGGQDNYAHLETSANAGLTAALSLLTTPTLPTFPANGGLVSFYYHMYGATIGTLSVSACPASGACSVLWTLTGQQQTTSAAAWRVAVVNLPSNTVTVQWSGTQGTSFTGDMAIDTIRVVQGNTLSPTSAPTAPTGAPTIGPCVPSVTGALFAVTTSTPVVGCTGGGGPTSAVPGTCYTTTAGTCFTDGTGAHGNNERCTINVLQTSYLSTVGTVTLEPCCDWLQINGSTDRLQTTAAISGTRVTGGQQILWRSDGSVVNDGFIVCVSAAGALTAHPTATPFSFAPLLRFCFSFAGCAPPRRH